MAVLERKTRKERARVAREIVKFLKPRSPKVGRAMRPRLCQDSVSLRNLSVGRCDIAIESHTHWHASSRAAAPEYPGESGSQ